MIRRLLVANRGEIARRIFTTCRAMGIGTVAVYSGVDAGAPHVRDADRAVALPGDGPAGSYLRADLIVAAAQAAGADAVHPGYGFLAENAGFAAAVMDAGLTWVGPPPKAIAVMGSKLEAKALLAGAGVPMLPSHADPAEVSRFPVLVKASAGGGGKGMRIVRDPAGLADAVAAARREAAAAFGDDTVFCERYVEGARHIEVQVFADNHGTVVTLGERECSIQRRHQKIVEESPSPAVSPALRDKLCAAASAAAGAVGYVGAGTVEFLLAPDGRFYFLEMNTRLQVEHPVTECVYGVDLVRWQLRVAEGATLDQPPHPRGHAIEVRLYAEDPAHDWRPATGTVHAFDIPGVRARFRPPGWDSDGGASGSGIRVDSGVVAGSGISPYYDPMLAKVIAWAPNRAEAARVLAGALARARIHGVTTNRDLLVRVLRHPEFGSGHTDTGFLDRLPAVFAPLADRRTTMLCCLAAALAGAAGRRDAAREAGLTVPAGIPAGFRNVGPARQTVRFGTPHGSVEVCYAFGRAGDLAGWSVQPADQDPPATVRAVSVAPDEGVLDVDGIRLAYTVGLSGHTYHVDCPQGYVELTELPRFPQRRPAVAEGSLLAPLPGTVGRVLVSPGQHVAQGELLLTLEAMKLEHPVQAPTGGVVADVPVSAGSQVDTGAVLAVITPAPATGPAAAGVEES